MDVYSAPPRFKPFPVATFDFPTKLIADYTTWKGVFYPSMGGICHLLGVLNSLEDFKSPPHVKPFPAATFDFPAKLSVDCTT